MDKELESILKKETNRQTVGVELIASENYVSKDVLNAMGSIFTNKYAEGYPGHRYYGGCQYIDEVEILAQNRLKELYNAEWVNVQPHSGSQANMAVLTTCLNPGDTFMGLDLSHGGHLTHGSKVNFSGIIYNAISYHLNEYGFIDYDEMEKLAREHKPKLIIAGASAYSRDWDYKRIRNLANEIDAIFMVDMAHPAGLIATGLLKNPLEYAHIVTSTTHKTLRGPRGGIILMGKDFPNPFGKVDSKGNIKMMSQLLDSAIFPGIQGGPLEHIIAAKAVAFGEALKPEFKDYQRQVLTNAQVMAEEFINLGYKVISDGTDNHCILVDLRKNFPDLTGKEAEKILQCVDITTNKNMVPFDSRSPFQTSGLRFGTAAITTRGLKENEVRNIVSWIDYALRYKDHEDSLKDMKTLVNIVMKQYPIIH